VIIFSAVLQRAHRPARQTQARKMAALREHLLKKFSSGARE
jgi:hypothetical protein